jgi:hypothetical protein
VSGMGGSFPAIGSEQVGLFGSATCFDGSESILYARVLFESFFGGLVNPHLSVVNLPVMTFFKLSAESCARPFDGFQIELSIVVLAALVWPAACDES